MANPVDKIKYVLSEYKGLIVEVFEVREWYQKPKYTNEKAKNPGKEYLGWGFNGIVANEEIKNQYYLKSIAHLKKRGSSQVIRVNIKET